MIIRIFDNTEVVEIDLPDRVLGGIVFSTGDISIRFAPFPSTIKIVSTKGVSDMPKNAVQWQIKPGAKKCPACRGTKVECHPVFTPESGITQPCHVCDGTGKVK